MKREKKEALLKELADRTPESGKYWKKSKDLVPGGLLSGARKMEPYPVYVERGAGAYLWDIDGNRYIDNVMSYGVHVLGHRPEPVVKAAQDQLLAGMSYGTPHTREVDFTRRFIDCVPCAELAMLCNSGTEATMLAWRLMRAATNKPKIAKFEGCYHGWHDYAQWSVSPQPESMGPDARPNSNAESAGIPPGVRESILVLPFNENAFQLIENHAHELAGVAIEPVIGGGMLTVDKDFMQRLRDVSREKNVLLHFDEVITGFRVALGGCQELNGILPDIATYGKIIGGGTPVGAIACSKEMVAIAQKTDESFTAAGTFSGNPMTLAVGTAVLSYLAENRHIYEEMANKGEYLRSSFNTWCEEKGYAFCMTGIGSMFQIHAKKEVPKVPRDVLGQDKDVLSGLQLYFRLNNILLPWIHLAFFSSVHSQEDIDTMLESFKNSVNGVVED